MTVLGNIVPAVENGEYFVTTFSETIIKGGYHLTVRVVSHIEGDALGYTIQIGRSLTVELLAGQGARQFIITFWHEMVEFAAINGALQVVTLSHDDVEATALALADLYGAPTFRVLSLVLESLGL